VLFIPIDLLDFPVSLGKAVSKSRPLIFGETLTVKFDYAFMIIFAVRQVILIFKESVDTENKQLNMVSLHEEEKPT